jgi:hypothetical protein
MIPMVNSETHFWQGIFIVKGSVKLKDYKVVSQRCDFFFFDFGL